VFERLTDRARRVMALANQQAERYNHEYVGTEHVLLGFVHEGSGIGANVLKKIGIDLRRVRLEVEKIIKIGPEMVAMRKLPQSPQTKKVIEYAIEEARSLGHNHVGTEHILLGLLRVSEGVAADVLTRLGTSIEQVRQALLSYLEKETGQLSLNNLTDMFKAFVAELAAEVARAEKERERAEQIISNAKARAEQIIAESRRTASDPE
jgi:ATP-dependent Clp protease ATP-binding subunit ClpA